MLPNRPQRVAGLLKQEIYQIIFRQLKDPRIKSLTITKVSLSKDLKFAKVFVSVLGNEQEKNEVLAGLKQATGFIRHELRRQLSLRYIPQLSFWLDESIAYSIRITQLINNLNNPT